MKSNGNAAPQDDRRSRRTEIRVPATVEAGPGQMHHVIILNVSAHGVMAEIEDDLVPGRPVTLTMPGVGSVAGRIAWLRDGHGGIAFATPLTLDQINAVL